MPGLLRGMARTAVVAGTATAVSNRVSRRQGNRWAQQAAPACIRQVDPGETEGRRMSFAIRHQLAGMQSIHRLHPRCQDC